MLGPDQSDGRIPQVDPFQDSAIHTIDPQAIRALDKSFQDEVRRHIERLRQLNGVDDLVRVFPPAGPLEMAISSIREVTLYTSAPRGLEDLRVREFEWRDGNHRSPRIHRENQ